MAQKLSMQSPDLADEKFAQLAALFPNAVTEYKDENGCVVRAIDKDVLSQEIAAHVLEGREERYQFTWPDKREAIRMANTPSTQCLRPCREESVDFDTTQNLYIEGDNLEVLKLLRENYLGKVKMIYIDPPYNTGNDFVYNDDFAESVDSFKERDGQKDEQGNRLFKNTDSNGRFHTDWLNMMYPRLKVARDLLSEDGVIFVSIGEEEIHNLKKICDEVFGSSCFRNSFITRRYDKNLNRQFMEEGLQSFNVGFEYIICYSQKDFIFNPIFREASEERKTKGYWKGFWNDADRPTMRYDILGFTPESGQWKWKQEAAYEAVRNYKIYEENYSQRMSLEEYWVSTGKSKKFIRRNINGRGKNAGVENWIAPSDTVLRNTSWLDLLASKNDVTTQGLFDFPKNVEVIKLALEAGVNKDSLIIDFFSGSATTAHAVMKLNAEDGGNRRFIMVQLPELTDEKSEAYKAGYKNICEIGKERIRRAGAAIRNEELGKRNEELLDVGFRVLKLDSSNMKDVYYRPEEIGMGQQDLFEENIKEDRSAEDLLFQVMPELGIELSVSIRKEELGMRNGVEVFNVGDGYLMACFDDELNEEIITEIAKRKPAYFVTRDRAFGNDAMAVNMEQIFTKYSPDTVRRVI